MIFLISACQQSKKMNTMTKTENAQVYEVALYRVKDQSLSSFEQLHDGAFSRISTYQGHVKAFGYKSLDKENLFLDVALWNSLEEAKQAQRKFESEDFNKNFMSSIETIVLFDHVKTVSENGILSYNDLESQDILELAAFYTNGEDLVGFDKTRLNILNYIGETYAELKRVHTVQFVNDETRFIDLGIWKNAESCGVIQKKVESHELFGAFASHFDMEKEMTMEFFKKI